MKSLSTDIRAWMVACATALALTLAGCASTETAKPAEPAAKVAPPSSAAPVAPAAAPAAAPPSGDVGTIVFFRPSKFAGGAVTFKVREGEQELGKLSSGTYFTAHVPAGPHAFTVHSEAKDVLNLEVERGETYYVQGSISMGIMVGRPNLAPSDEATFNSMKAKLKDSAASGKKK